MPVLSSNARPAGAVRRPAAGPGRRALRSLRSGLGAAITVALTAAAFSVPTAAPAQANPYIPWSTYLPGWTEEFIPTSENDCVAGRPQCLRATLKELNRILVHTGRSCSHNAIFALSYTRMTQSYGWSREVPGYYQDVPFANHQGAVFARYYTDAYTNWQRGNRDQVPPAWLIAFDAAENKRVTGFGDLLLGMNAHINRDLPFVLAGVGLVAPDGSSRKRDYDRVEHFLNLATGPMLAEAAARFDPTLDDTAEPTGLAQTVLFQLITVWRENAWRNAELLVTAPTPDARARVATLIENEAKTIARTFLLAQSYLPPLTSTTARDRFCARNHDARASVDYPFGAASPYGL
jgi:hypothetical protein